ncbi:MAG: hypothetical protein K9I85_12570 [Saprospiraceae bacterium]|nr:hypothetical protein [Saprospiraceae bacterium]
MSHRLLLACALLIFGISAPAQKILQIEKAGSLKTWRFHVGDELTFSDVGQPDQFYTREIVNLFPDIGIVQLTDVALHLDSIAVIAFPGSNHWAKGLGNTLLTFASVWTLYSLLDSAINSRAPAPFQYYAGGGAWVGGAALRWCVPETKKTIGKHYRVRMLDLTFYPTEPK